MGAAITARNEIPITTPKQIKADETNQPSTDFILTFIL